MRLFTTANDMASPTRIFPFLNEDQAAKKRAVTDVSVNSNVVGVFTPNGVRWRRFQKIRDYYNQGRGRQWA